MQLLALVGKPWNVIGLFDSISERSPKGLEHRQSLVVLTVYFTVLTCILRHV